MMRLFILLQFVCVVGLCQAQNLLDEPQEYADALVGNVKLVHQVEYEGEEKLANSEEYRNMSLFLNEEGIVTAINNENGMVKEFIYENGQLMLIKERNSTTGFENDVEFTWKSDRELHITESSDEDIELQKLYNEENQLIKTIERNPFLGDVEIIHNYTYNENGQIRSDEFWEGNLPNTTSIYHYDEHGKLTSILETYERFGVEQEITLKYDEHGSLIEYNTGEYINSYTYKYDEKGNWIEKRRTNYATTETKPNEADWITKRTITYYE